MDRVNCGWRGEGGGLGGGLAFGLLLGFKGKVMVEEVWGRGVHVNELEVS